MEHKIYDAASHGKLSLIKNVLEHRPKEERVQLLSSKTAGATPLIVSCRNGHHDVAEYLIKTCGADVEITGSVDFDGEQIMEVTPLWCAAAAGYLSIVKLLIKHGAKVNSTTKTNSTPLRAACFDGHLDIVQFLVESGADIEVANRHGHSCLMIACYKNHYYIAKYLIEKGADINRKSVKSNTALHDCAESGALAIMKLLLSKGAVFDVDSYRMSPLLASAVSGHSNIVDYILTLNRVSEEEKIDALELLGATYVDNKKDMTGAHRYWMRALELRYRDGQLIYPKPTTSGSDNVYEGRREVDTFEQMTEIISDPDEMRMQSLMIRERVLGQGHPDTSYYIRYRGAVYADSNDFVRCISLWNYALNMQQKTMPALSPLTQGSFLSFAELFWFMMGDKKTFYPLPTLNFNDVYVIFWKAVKEVETSKLLLSRMNEKNWDIVSFHRLLVITLQILTVLLNIEKDPEEDYKFRKTAYQLVKQHPLGSRNWSLLHISASQNSSVGRFAMKIFPSPKLVRFLVSVGADVNSRDEDGNSPLHIAGESKSCSPELVLSLLRLGCHVDQVNNEKKTFNDVSTVPLSSVVDPMLYITLKCLSATTVARAGVVYKGIVPSQLEAFVDIH